MHKRQIMVQNYTQIHEFKVVGVCGSGAMALFEAIHPTKPLLVQITVCKVISNHGFQFWFAG